MKKFILLLCFSLSSFSIFAGSADAIIKGKSASGKTNFTCILHDVTSGLYSASLIIDGEKIEFTEEEDAVVFYDFSNRVFTIYLHNKDNTKELYFWMIPTTFKKIKGDNFTGIYKFKAKIYATDPRKNKERFSPETIITCAFEYEI